LCSRLESTESIEEPRVSTRDPRAHKIVSFPLNFEEPICPGPAVEEGPIPTLNPSVQQTTRPSNRPSIHSRDPPLPQPARGAYPDL